jgi:hypothetical protein
VPPRYLPEPPRAVVARAAGPGRLTVSWRPPLSGGALGHPATSYRVYHGTHGHAFDNGRDSGGQTSLTLQGLAADSVHYLRVTAVNAGGESLPSPTLALRLPAAGGSPPLLLVTGFDRWDAKMNLRLTYPKLRTVHRLQRDRINNGTYLVQHGRALGRGWGGAFDACTHEAVELGASWVDPGRYRLVWWQGGRGIVGGQGLSAAARQALDRASRSGVYLALSGTRLARTLGGPGASTAQRDFLLQRLHARFQGATARQTGVTASAGGFLAGLARWDLATQQAGPYDVPLPDVIEPAGGVRAAGYLTPGGGAVTQFRQQGQCAVLLGFPLEAALPPARQAEIAGRLLSFCRVGAGGRQDGGPGDTDGGADRGAGGDIPPVAGDGAGEPPGGCDCRVAGRRTGPGGGPPAGSLLVLAIAVCLSLHRRQYGRRH